MLTVTMPEERGFINRLFRGAGMGRPATFRGDTGIAEADFVVIDTELTGLKPRIDSVISVGAVHMTGTRIELGQSFYRVVKPRGEVSGTSVVIHGITPTEAHASPSFDVLLPEFLAFCEGRIIVGYCVNIDMVFLNGEIRQLGRRGLRNPVIDTLKLYTWIRRKQRDACAFDDGCGENMGLTELGDKFGISTTHMHNALSDAYITAQLFQQLLALASGYGIRRVEDLLIVARPD